MRTLLVFTLFAALLGCNNSSSDKETKTDSTVVKKDTMPIPPKTDTMHAPPKTDSVAKASLMIDATKSPGNVGIASFAQGGKPLFYYNVDTKKGSISINGKKYDFNSYAHEINGPSYTLKSGSDLTIKVEGTKYHDYANPEPGILKGKAATVTITLGADKLELKNVDVTDGTNAD